MTTANAWRTTHTRNNINTTTSFSTFYQLCLKPTKRISRWRHRRRNDSHDRDAAQCHGDETESSLRWQNQRPKGTHQLQHSWNPQNRGDCKRGSGNINKEFSAKISPLELLCAKQAVQLQVLDVALPWPSPFPRSMHSDNNLLFGLINWFFESWNFDFQNVLVFAPLIFSKKSHRPLFLEKKSLPPDLLMLFFGSGSNCCLAKSRIP